MRAVLNKLKESFDMCMLNMVYTDPEDHSILYEVILTDKNYRSAGLLRIGFEELKELADTGLAVGYSFDGGYLRADSGVKRSLINDTILETRGELIMASADYYTFYDLLENGYDGEFILLDSTEEGLESEEQVVASFTDIQFSQSTMTVYVMMRVLTELHNKILMCVEDGELKMNSFLFGVPSGHPFSQSGCTFVAKKCINGIDYNIFKADVLPIYTDCIYSDCLINKIVQIRARSYNARATVKDLLSSLFASFSQGTESSSFTWAKKSKSYSTFYGVKLRSSFKNISSAERQSLIRMTMECILTRQMSAKEFSVYLEKDTNYDPMRKYACLSIAAILCSDEDRELKNLFPAAQDVQRYLNSRVFCCDLFLYKVRSLVYLSHKMLAPAEYPFLFGGCELGYTIVEEGFFYGAGE